MRHVPLVLISIVLAPLAAAQEAVPAAAIGAVRAQARALVGSPDCPGLSLAIAAGGRLVWAEGFGVKARGEPEGVDEGTLFQAASISKPVAALAALRLVAEGRLELDGAVNDRLTRWLIPASVFQIDRPVTVRGLLTHTGGLSVHGFAGYAAGAELPTELAILDGVAPSNSPPVRTVSRPGGAWRYSGGGYVVLQVLLTDVAQRPFPVLMRELILEPLAMRSSTYEQPLPEGRRAEAALAHPAHRFGDASPWHVYPEQAAAGLWTTPTDLVRLLLAVARAWRGAPDGILSPALARAMLTAEPGTDQGLGFRLGAEDADLRFGHGGVNWGFRADVRADASTGFASVVMINGSDDDAVGVLQRRIHELFGGAR